MEARAAAKALLERLEADCPRALQMSESVASTKLLDIMDKVRERCCGLTRHALTSVGGGKGREGARARARVLLAGTVLVASIAAAWHAQIEHASSSLPAQGRARDSIYGWRSAGAIWQCLQLMSLTWHLSLASPSSPLSLLSVRSVSPADHPRALLCRRRSSTLRRACPTLWACTRSPRQVRPPRSARHASPGGRRPARATPST